MSEGVRARAAVAHERGVPLRIEEVVVRESREGEVRVRIAACGICAGDLYAWRTGEVSWSNTRNYPPLFTFSDRRCK